MVCILIVYGTVNTERTKSYAGWANLWERLFDFSCILLLQPKLGFADLFNIRDSVLFGIAMSVS